MSQLLLQQNNALVPNRDHNQWRGVSFSFQPPFDSFVSMSMTTQKPCQKSSCVPCPPGIFAGHPTTQTGCYYDSNCNLKIGQCPTRDRPA